MDGLLWKSGCDFKIPWARSPRLRRNNFFPANIDVVASARGKEVKDSNGTEKIEIDRLLTKIRVGDGNIRLKAPPAHRPAGIKFSYFFNLIFS